MAGVGKNRWCTAGIIGSPGGADWGTAIAALPLLMNAGSWECAGHVNSPVVARFLKIFPIYIQTQLQYWFHSISHQLIWWKVGMRCPKAARKLCFSSVPYPSATWPKGFLGFKKSWKSIKIVIWNGENIECEIATLDKQHKQHHCDVNLAEMQNAVRS